MARTRELLRGIRGDGPHCHAGTRQEMPCNLLQCPEECQWEQWSTWSGCFCQTKVQNRTRQLKAYASGGVNMTCDPQDGVQTQNCSWSDCPVNCEWSDWGGWSDCDRLCGGGWTHRQRQRKVLAHAGGQDCTGEPREEQSCNSDACDIDCSWSPWSVSDCSATCGGGLRERARTVDVQPSGNGRLCTGEATIREGCNQKPCPVDCVWANWEPWGECSKSCATGSANRTRGILQVASNGGRRCEDQHGVEFRNCNEAVACPVDCIWEDWGDWTTCSEMCGRGVRTRGRPFIQEESGGRACSHADASMSEECVGVGPSCPPLVPAPAPAPLEQGIFGTMTLDVEEKQNTAFAGFCSAAASRTGRSTALQPQPECPLNAAIADAIRSGAAHHGGGDAASLGYTVQVAVLQAPSTKGLLGDNSTASRSVLVHFDIPAPPPGVRQALWTLGYSSMKDELNSQLAAHTLADEFRVVSVLGLAERQ